MAEAGIKTVVQQLTKVWVAMLIAPAIAAALLYDTPVSPESQQLPPFFPWIFAGVAAAELAAAFLFSSLLLKRGPTPPLHRLRTASVIRFSLIDGSALQLIVAGVITGKRELFLLCAVPLVVLLSQRPTVRSAGRMLKSVVREPAGGRP